MSQANSSEAGSISKEVTETHDFQHEFKLTDLIHEKRPWYKVSHLRKLVLAIFLITITSTNNGYDGSMLNGLQSLAHWQKEMGHPNGAILGNLSNGTVFGMVAATPFAPYLNDKFGRWKMIVLGEIICVIGGILQGVSNSYGFFLGARIVIGFGSCIAAVGSPALIAEIAYPTHRETSTYSYNVCWYLGAIVASWVTYGTRNIDGRNSWSIPSYLQAALPGIQVLLFWLVPESPRFYCAQGQREKARAVFVKYHIGGSTDAADIEFIEAELNEIEAALELERQHTHASYSDFFTKKSFLKRFYLVVAVSFMTQLSGNGLVSYYLVKVLESIGITSTKKQLQINGCLMIYNFVLCAAFASVASKFRRRTMFLTCMVGMLVSYILWTALSAVNEQRNFEDKGFANGVLAMIFIYYMFYDIGLNGLPFLYATEILPYSHRAKGMTILQFSVAICLIYNGYVNSIAMDAISWKYYIVYCCILAVELLLVYFTFPETSGYSLEEVARVFGDEAPDLSLPQEKKISLEHVEGV